MIREFGWPERSVLGDDCVGAFWLLVQHADADVDFQAAGLEALTGAVHAGDADARWLALLTDRVRLARGHRQLFGTQCEALGGKWVPRPLEDEASVEERRERVGLPPLSEYLADITALYGDPPTSHSSPR